MTRGADHLTREAARLLEALCRPGAHAVADARSGRLRVVQATGRVSLGGGEFAAASGEELVGRDGAAWRREGARAALHATEAGRALAARRAAPDDPFGSQHRDLAPARLEPDGPPVLVNHAESPLAWLRRRGGGDPMLTPARFEAGERLRRDLELARSLPRVTASWDLNARLGGGPGEAALTPSERMLAARQRVRAALNAVGPDMAGLLVDVCGFLKGLQQVESERRWPARSAKVALALALGRLAAHYGLADEVRGPARARAIETWFDESDEKAAG